LSVAREIVLDLAHRGEIVRTVIGEEEVVVRPIAPGEYQAVVSVLVDAYATEWGSDGWGDYRGEMERVDDRAREALVVVAMSGADVIGTLTVVPPKSALRSIVHDDAVELRFLAVSPSKRGQGVGRLLVAEASARARALGHRSLVLQCDEDLAAAQEFYRSIGFVRAEEHDIEVAGNYRALGYRRDLAPGD
jgi:ribosomal protein S18 acetylase RimI-like enzyme